MLSTLRYYYTLLNASAHNGVLMFAITRH